MLARKCPVTRPTKERLEEIRVEVEQCLVKGQRHELLAEVDALMNERKVQDYRILTHELSVEQTEKYWRARHARFRESLLSISKNGCCGLCQEAKLVAQQALAADEQDKE